MNPDADRNLLLAVLALQVNFVSRDDLVSAMHDWATDRTRSLGEVLLSRGALTAEQRQALDLLLSLHLKAHGNDPHRSLESLTTSGPVGDLLRIVAGVTEDPGDVATVSRASQSEQRPPVREGSRYRIVRPHAHGGLGEVFVAEDTELHREVALKEIKASRANDSASRARFVLEAEITGRLEHPGVVPVYGFGTYADGRPYYAMRFIRGETFKQAIERFHSSELPAGERRFQFHALLGRFIAACNAIAYAHSRGVLHRDIKPSNIMLGRFGETLVVDWGLAKAGYRTAEQGCDSEDPTTDPSLHPHSGSDMSPTIMGSALGTPQYMSPEQASGRLGEVSPASDVYSLGVTLYVLLTGKKPFDSDDNVEVLALVQGGQFVPPRVAHPDVPPALNAICLKAMALQPEDRYQSALDLAADLEHWLADEPVTAWREPPLTRLGRWARRHRTAVSTGVVVLLAAVVGLSVTTALVAREQRRTEWQRQLAEENYALARDLSYSSVDLIAAAESEFAANAARQAARRDLLKAAARAFRRHLEHNPTDAVLRARTAQVYRYTANVHRLVGEVADAEVLYRGAVDLYSGLAEEFSYEPIHRDNLSSTLRDYAKLLSDSGRLRDGAAALARAVDLAEAMHREAAERSDRRRTLAAALLTLASLQYSQGAISEAGQTARRSAELFDSLSHARAAEQHPYDVLFRFAAQNIAAMTERESNQLDSAFALHDECVTHLQEMLRQGKAGLNMVDVQFFLASFESERGRTLGRMKGRESEGIASLASAINRMRELLKEFKQVPRYSLTLGGFLVHRGQIYAALGQNETAWADFREAVSLMEPVIHGPAGTPSARGDLGRAYLGLGRLDLAAGDQATARDWFTRAEQTLRQVIEQSPERAHERRSLDEARAALGGR